MRRTITGHVLPQGQILLGYFVSDLGRFNDPSVIQGKHDPVAVVQFNSYTHMFGMPNDEALRGHPLYERGLNSYRVYEVINSSWIRQLEKMNSVHPCHNPKGFAALRHFVVTLHDSTFECVARDFKVRILLGKHRDPESALLGLMNGTLT